MTALASHLEGARRDRALDSALAAVRAIPGERTLAETLVAVLPLLDDERLGWALDEALEIARATAEGETWDDQKPQDDALAPIRFTDGSRRAAQLLSGLAPSLTSERLGDALEIAQLITNERWRVEALAALAPYLAGESLEEALEDALTATRGIQFDAARADALAALAPRLAEDGSTTHSAWR